MEPQKILEALRIEDEVLNIYTYGSQVYGTAGPQSDEDFVIVTKAAQLTSGAFRQNAISSRDRKIQGILFSRSGFQDAINNYDITALECLSLPQNLVIQEKKPFVHAKWSNRDLSQKIIEKASASWYIASRQSREEQKDLALKGIFHALRILIFGNQLKENQRIVDFAEANWILQKMKSDPIFVFDDREWMGMRDELMEKLRA